MGIEFSTWLFLLASLLLLASVWGFWHRLPAAMLVVDVPEQLELVVDPPQDTTVGITFRNRGSKPVRILGVDEYCGKNGCIRAKHKASVEIAPGHSLVFECSVSVGSAPSFSAKIVVYVADPVLRELVLGMEGELSSNSKMIMARIKAFDQAVANNKR